MSAMKGVSFVAFYLPQFYPFPENDQWWGKGFTEWTNAAKARPLFEGHHQPHLPADLGFYDLRVRETRLDQMSLAKEYGIDGFCYHYYWFGGKRLLLDPLQAMLSDPESDMPFCLCWANENWTRAWDAKEKEILIKQDYTQHNDDKFIDDLLPFFLDSRYIRVDGSVLLVVYRPQQIPDITRRAEHWRKRCQQNNIKLHLCSALTHGNETYSSFSFDSGVEFPPHNPKIPSRSGELTFFNEFNGHVLSFSDMANSYLDRNYPDANVYKCIFPSWDNTARRNSNALVVTDGTPENFEVWLKKTCDLTSQRFPDEHRIIFINAWNEWAEGCHLEPDARHGRGFLEAVRRVKTGQSRRSSFNEIQLCQAADPVQRIMSSNRVKQKRREEKTLSWKAKREVRRIGLQISHRKFKVTIPDTKTSPALRNGARASRRNPVGRSVFANAYPSVSPDLEIFTDYEYDLDLTSDTAGAHVVHLTGTGKRVLEVGAGSGAITKHLAKRNDEVVAIEINPKSIEKLRRYVSKVYSVDLNDANWADDLSASGKFDVVVAADVLEHLYDPWQAIRNMKKLLTEDGSIVTSLPHAGHCSVMGCLMQGDFEYREWGLLDKTHIRFFGLHNIQTLYQGVGLAITDARYVIRPPEQTEFAQRWNTLPEDARKTLSRSPHANVYQIVTRGVANKVGVDGLTLT